MWTGLVLAVCFAGFVGVESSPTPLEFRSIFGGKAGKASDVAHSDTGGVNGGQVKLHRGLNGDQAKPVPPAFCSLSIHLRNDQTKPGDTLLAIGSVPALGNWKDATALKFHTSSASFPIWEAKTSLPPGEAVEFKFVVRKASGDLAWEQLKQGENRAIVVPVAQGVTLETSFGDQRATTKVEGEFSSTAEDEAEEEEALRSAAPAAESSAESSVESKAESKEESKAESHVESLSVTEESKVESKVENKEIVSAQAGGEVAHPPKDLTARLFFRIRCETKMGEDVQVCGSAPSIGGWKPQEALPLKTNADEYPFWSGCAEVGLSHAKNVLKYKYLIKHATGAYWEDAIADREVQPDKGTKGVLAPGLDTYVDDGGFNNLQRVCTYVREREVGGERPKLQPAPIESGPYEVPEGMQLVTLDQVLQWQAQLVELEEECQHWRDRIETAEATKLVLANELEQGFRRKEEIVHSMGVCEEYLSKLEEEVERVEEKKAILRTSMHGAAALPT
eukprot:CAMPEP_0181322790 /NCGR_PEP_ID=MMETSP1101-20121128/19421_1 /TAXON_ID=46948 /ORGANISM="Rhodomonas abbreviata, Strain Caron Lab Isolate" /LENGTH=505 /DNA_ID=CAMNT_0023430737 /DNA_START=153 /DNA_END=1670 /DNA_ORIENTATION=+